MNEVIEALTQTFLERDVDKISQNELAMQQYEEYDYGRVIYPDATLRDYSELNLHPISWAYLKQINLTPQLKYAISLIEPMFSDDPNDLLTYQLYKFVFSSLLDTHSVLFSIEAYQKLKSYIIDFAKNIINEVGDSPAVFFLARLGFHGEVNHQGFVHFSKFTKFMNYIVADGKIIPYSYITQNEQFEKTKRDIALDLYNGDLQSALYKAMSIDNKGISRMLTKIIKGGFYG